ncbi:MAG TPA: uracil phosphoribosyltransferase [Acidimicrobiales bacterium]|nr:uracil phosphoribosyltransferase [Acidimicrobiales bacterium]
MKTTVVQHPLVAERLTRLRDQSTPSHRFRADLDDLASFLIYEATRSLATRAVRVRTPLAETDGVVLDGGPLIVPVLRAGLGMLAAAQRLLPHAPVGFIGVRRNETTLLPAAYMSTVPADLEGQPVLVLDPMLATGGSLVYTCEQLLEHHAGPMTVVCVLAAPEGLRHVEEAGFDLEVVTATVDERLNDVGFIHPGLGDAGDRQFGIS